MARKILFDIKGKKLIKSIDSNVPASLRPFYANDEEDIELHSVIPNPDSNSNLKYIYQSLSGVTKVGIGVIDIAPDDGTFTLADTAAAETTGAMNSDITAAAMQAEIRSSLSTNWGSASVTLEGGFYIINRGEVGVIPNLVGDGSGLSPESITSISTLRTGTASFSQISGLFLRQKAAAYIESGWASLPAAQVSISEIQTGGGGSNAVFKIAINSDTYQGTFSISSSQLGAGNDETKSSQNIAFNASSSDFKSAVDSGWGSSNSVSVVKVNNYTWHVELNGTNIAGKDIDAGLTGNASGLGVPIGLTGSINLRTGPMASLLKNLPNKILTFEIENYNTKPDTLLQVPATVINDLINPETAGGSEVPSPLTEAEADLLYIRRDGSNVVAAPATAGSTGTAGQMAYDSNYEYRCVATNTWKRSPHASW